MEKYWQYRVLLFKNIYKNIAIASFVFINWNAKRIIIKIEKEIASLEGNAENIINQFNNVDNEENANNDEMVNNEEEWRNNRNYWRSYY